ncbi:MAG: hypothetical protein QJR09_08065 [Micrococcus sp.]|nr:hypothetical protein [Micrococcus sp.]
MNRKEITQALIYANGADERVPTTPANEDIWIRALTAYTYAEAKAAIQVYYERPFTGYGRRPHIEAHHVRRIIQQETERASAKASAVKALPRGSKDPTASWRERNPEEWDRLVAKGRDDRRADLARRGITLMDWQLENDQPADLSPAVRFQGWGAA